MNFGPRGSKLSFGGVSEERAHREGDRNVNLHHNLKTLSGARCEAMPRESLELRPPKRLLGALMVVHSGVVLNIGA